MPAGQNGAHESRNLLWAALPHRHRRLGPMLSVRFGSASSRVLQKMTVRKFSAVKRASALLRERGMNLNNRLEKLRRQQQQITQALKQAEAKASTQARKRQTRAKIILGATVLSVPAKEREVLLSMILPEMTERDRQFVSECLADDQPSEVPLGSDAQGKN